MKTATVFASALLIGACSSSPGAPDSGTDPPPPDGRGEADAAADDAPAADAAIDAATDAGAGDAGDPDAGPPDASLPECSTCHGGVVNAAPPEDLEGGSDTSRPGVGAHQSHLRSSIWYRTGECGDCHRVPVAVTDVGHLDAPLLAWGAIARADGIEPLYQDGACTVYCHGASLAGGWIDAPQWTVVDGSQAFCISCHGIPPPPPHPANSQCQSCHPFDGPRPIDPSTHPNGHVDFTGGPCGACHDVPPATGAHQVHHADASSPPLATYGDLRVTRDYAIGGTGYLFGCGNCHPTDAARHMDGNVDVDVSSTGAPPTSLKARNSAAASYTSGTCSGVYCHSSGQAQPVYAATPPWTAALPAPRCAACHGNPPRYPSGGAGSATANGHLQMGDDGWELGHFAGLPGPWHGSLHGIAGRGAAPITCQTCHFDTVDPDATGPGGFYYLDTTGDYDLGGNLGFRCDDCHTGLAGDPAAGAGAVLPVRHVDGTRDVVFDPRTSIPSWVTGLPDGGDRPSLPMWVDAIPWQLPPDSLVDGSTWSLHLGNATYDPVVKTCADVPCHLQQSFATSDPQWLPLSWGTEPVGNATCNACHQF